jgi:hypothetical protein
MNERAAPVLARPAGTSLATSVTAIATSFSILLQFHLSGEEDQAQAARAAYAEHLTLAVANPDLSVPVDACALLASGRGGAYAAFVDQLIVAGSLMIEVEPDWAPTLDDALAAHAAYVCSEPDAGDSTAEIAALLSEFRARVCAAQPPCPGA